MDSERLKIFQLLKKDGHYTKTITDFEKQYFENSSGIDKLYDFLISNLSSIEDSVGNNIYYYSKGKKDFYKKYACDLAWAKTTDYCKVETPPPPPPAPTPENFPDLIMQNYDDYLDVSGKTYYGAVESDKSFHFYANGKVKVFDKDSKKIGDGTYTVDGPQKKVTVDGITGGPITFSIVNQTQAQKDFLEKQKQDIAIQKQKEEQLKKQKEETEKQTNISSTLSFYSKKTGVTNWKDEASISEQVDKIIEFIRKNYRSNVFVNYYNALNYLSKNSNNTFYEIKKGELDNAGYTKERAQNPTQDQLTSGEFTTADLGETGLWPKEIYFYYKPFGIKVTNKMQELIDTYKRDNWQDRGGNPINSNEAAKYEQINMKDEDPEVFKVDYYLVKLIEDLGLDELFDTLRKFRNFNDPRSCRLGIGSYHALFEKQKRGASIPLAGSTLRDYKNGIKACSTNLKNFGDFGITKRKIKELSNDATSANTLSLKYTRPKTTSTPETTASIQDSYRNLKKTIKENLVKEKNKKLIKEDKFVGDRFEFVIESVGLKNRKDVDRIVEGIFYEMLYLQNNVENHKVIGENIQAIFDVLGTLFGGTKNAVVSTFKEKGIDFILSKLGLDKNSFMGDFLAVTFGNVDLKDVPRLFTDCDFLTKKIAEAVPEAYLKNLQDEKGFDSMFMDYVRNSLYDVIRDSDIAEKLEERIAGMICPITASLSSKFEDKLSSMKSTLSN